MPDANLHLVILYNFKFFITKEEFDMLDKKHTFGVSVNDMDPTTKAVYEGILQGIDKKVLANKYNMSLRNINAMIKRYRMGQKSNTLTPGVQVYDYVATETEEKESAMLNDIKELTKEEFYPVIDAIEDLLSNKSKKQIMKSRRLKSNQMDILIRIKSAINFAKENNKIVVELNEQDKLFFNSLMIDDLSDRTLIYDSDNDVIKYQSVATNTAPKRKAKVKITEELIQETISLLIDGDLTQKDISELTGLSASSVSRIYRKYKESINVLKGRTAAANVKRDENQNNATINNKPITETNVEHKCDKLCEINYHACLKVGLVSERHSMPVDEFIFKNITSIDMFSYDKLDNICRDFIKNNIVFVNGVAQQYLSVYVTGLQCALASLIKITNEMKVNLILRHYNNRTDSYNYQIIWNCFGADIVPDVFISLLINSVKLYTYDCSLDELYNIGRLYKIVKVHYQDYSHDIKYQETILVKDLGSTFKVMEQHINQASDANENVSIYAEEYTLQGVQFRISKESNFRLKLENKKK